MSKTTQGRAARGPDSASLVLTWTLPGEDGLLSLTLDKVLAFRFFH